MNREDSVLVAIMNYARDFRLARDEHWYRIPVDKAQKWGKRHWPPKWIAFYQTRIFKDEAYSVRLSRLPGRSSGRLRRSTTFGMRVR